VRVVRPALRGVAVVVLCALAAAWTSLALGRDRPVVARATPEVRAVPAGEAASFRILRRPLRAGDAFAAVRPGSGPVGANAALARTVRVPGAGLAGGAVSVVPANGWVCLRIPIGGGGAGWWCQTLALAREGKLIIALRPPGPLRRAGRQFLAGLAPDDVRSVSVTTTAGARLRVGVHSNVWSAVIDAPLSVAIALPVGGPRRYPAP
jgi:hypothetical protein